MNFWTAEEEEKGEGGGTMVGEEKTVYSNDRSGTRGYSEELDITILRYLDAPKQSKRPPVN